MTHLYELTEAHKELVALADTDSDIAIQDTLEAVEGEFEEKAKSLMIVVNGMGSDVDSINTEIKRLQERKKIIQNRQESLRDYLRHNMQESGIKKIECPLFTITLANGRDIVQIDNIDEIPTDFVEIETNLKPDKKTLLAALKSGEVIPGVSLVKSQSSVRIK